MAFLMPEPIMAKFLKNLCHIKPNFLKNLNIKRTNRTRYKSRYQSCNYSFFQRYKSILKKTRQTTNVAHIITTKPLHSTALSFKVKYSL